jgi:hypothetical protein
MTATAAPVYRDDIEVLPVDRDRITTDQQRQLLTWTFGPVGAELAELWAALNHRLWDGQLDPCPIWLPRCTTYGRWIGLCSGDPEARRTLSLQVKWQLSRQARADVILHEQLHQALIETGRNPQHNRWPWCQELMRITRELWGIEIWAAPAIPRKVRSTDTGELVSSRVQRRGPQGQTSITRQQIATWPASIGLHVPIEQLLATAADAAPRVPR